MSIIMPRWLRERERERINLYFGANDICVDSKGSVLFVIFLCVGERWLFLIVASKKFNILYISHANFRIHFIANRHN